METFAHGAARWEVACPRRPSRVAGVSMAGFRIHDLDALRVVPHPAVTLILDFGDGSPVLDCAPGRQQRGSIVAGPGLGSGGAVLARGENVACVQVRLSPAIARAVLGASPADLDGAVVPLDELWGPEASRIRERLGEVPSWEARFALTDALLARRHAAGPAVDPEVAWAWHRIVATHGLARVDAVAAEVGWSRKRLWSRFRSQLGLPPQTRRQADPLRPRRPPPGRGRPRGPRRGRHRLRRPVPSAPRRDGVDRGDPRDRGRRTVPRGRRPGLAGPRNHGRALRGGRAGSSPEQGLRLRRPPGQGQGRPRPGRPPHSLSRVETL